jgi:peptidylprolyl isomerase
VSNEKRKRQDENRAKKQEQVAVAATKAKRKSQLTRYLALGGAAIAAIVFLVVLNTGGGDDKEDVAASTTSLAAPTTIKSAEEPVITIPAGDPPKELTVTDLKVGTGPIAEKGDSIEVFYKGFSWLNKAEFDKNFGRGATFPVVLGAGNVIPGWDQGLIGAKEGGRRQLIIPPDLAYGDSAPTPAIAKGDTLVFVVDVVKVTKAAGTTTTAP